MSHQTGIKANNDLLTFFSVCKSSDNIRAVKISIKSESLVLDKYEKVVGTWMEDYERCLTKLIVEREPCYVFYRLDSLAETSYNWLFISWSPDDAPIKQKMIYASTKATLKKEFGLSIITSELFATVKTELAFKQTKTHLCDNHQRRQYNNNNYSNHDHEQHCKNNGNSAFLSHTSNGKQKNGHHSTQIYDKKLEKSLLKNINNIPIKNHTASNYYIPPIDTKNYLNINNFSSNDNNEDFKCPSPKYIPVMMISPINPPDAKLNNINVVRKDEITLKYYLKMQRDKEFGAKPLTHAEEERENFKATENLAHIGIETKQRSAHGLTFPLSPLLADTLREFALGKQIYLRMKIDLDHEMIDLESSSRSLDVISLARLIPRSNPRYHLYTFIHEPVLSPNKDTSCTKDSIFIYSMPEQAQCSIRERMLYSSCKHKLIDTLKTVYAIDIPKNFEIDSGDEINQSILLQELHPLKTEVSGDIGTSAGGSTSNSKEKFAKPKGPTQARGPRRLIKNL